MKEASDSVLESMYKASLGCEPRRARLRVYYSQSITPLTSLLSNVSNIVSQNSEAK